MIIDLRNVKYLVILIIIAFIGLAFAPEHSNQLALPKEVNSKMNIPSPPPPTKETKQEVRKLTVVATGYSYG